MRRQAPTVELSPQLLRQFGLITLIITALIAMFASGEHEQVEAAMQARAARNHLLAVEARKIGSRKIVAAMNIKPEQGGEGFERLNGKNPVTSPPTPPTSGSGAPSTGQPDFIILPDGRKGMAMERGPDGKFHPVRGKAHQPSKPTPEQLEKMREQSRLRSGQAAPAGTLPG